MPKPPLRDEAFADQGVVDFLDRLPRHLPHSEKAAACLEQFGAARAWDTDKVARYWKWRHPKGTGRTTRIALDADLRDFIEDRLGCVTLDELTDACRERYGQDRAPSWSAIQRYAKRRRKSE